jgi:hypothetical protein
MGIRHRVSPRVCPISSPSASVTSTIETARFGEFEWALGYSNIKSIFFINRKSLSGWVAKGVNSYSM